MKKNYNYDETERWARDGFACAEKHLKYSPKRDKESGEPEYERQSGVFKYVLAVAIVAIIVSAGTFGTLKYLEHIAGAHTVAPGAKVTYSEENIDEFVYITANGKTYIPQCRPSGVTERTSTDTIETLLYDTALNYGSSKILYGGGKLSLELYNNVKDREMRVTGSEVYKDGECVFRGYARISDLTDYLTAAPDGEYAVKIDVTWEAQPVNIGDKCRIYSVAFTVNKNAGSVPENTRGEETSVPDETVPGNYTLQNIVTGMKCKPGETLNFGIKATNVSGETWNIFDLNSFFRVTVYTYVDGQIYIASSPVKDEVEPYTWRSGKSLSMAFAVTFSFDAPDGDYNLSVTLNGEKTVIKNFAKVVSDTGSQETDKSGLLYGLYEPYKVYILCDCDGPNRNFAEQAGVQLFNDLPANDGFDKVNPIGPRSPSKPSETGNFEFLGNSYSNLKYSATARFVNNDSDIDSVNRTEDELLKAFISYDVYQLKKGDFKVSINAAECTGEIICFSVSGWDSDFADANAEINEETAKEAAVNAAKALGRDTEGYSVEIESISDYENKATNETYTLYKIEFKKQYSENVYTGYSFKIVNGGAVVGYSAHQKWFAPIPLNAYGEVIIPDEVVRKIKDAKKAFASEYLPFDDVSYNDLDGSIMRFGEKGALAYVEGAFFSEKQIAEIAVEFIIVLPEDYQ